MAFSPPQFNVLADVWYCGHAPATHVPDAENLTVQLYINSRAPFSIDDPFFQVFDYPATFVRIPASADATWKSAHILEIPAESGRYYKARWKDIMHLGFPNEYRAISVAQCDAEGTPISRDVCGPHPGGGDMSLTVQVSAAGVGVNSSGPTNFGTGLMQVEVTLEADGAGTQA